METRDARRALLARLIDHAPTFPPAALSPTEALAEDARASGSRQAFMLARLVWPASRLEELPPGPRALSVVLDAPLPRGREVEAVEAGVGGADLQPSRAPSTRSTSSCRSTASSMSDWTSSPGEG